DIDLSNGRLKGSGVLSFDPGREALIGAEPAIQITLSGHSARPEASFDAGPLSRFLTQRSLEIQQARVEAMQERLVERQRLRRELRYYMERAEERENAASPLDV